VSASFNIENLPEEDFDPDTYVRKLCENTKLEMHSYLKSDFPQGWKNIIRDFIDSIKNYPVSIIRIHDAFSVLDVRFEVQKPTKEVYVWRAINKARMDSAITCALCGSEIRSRRSRKVSDIYCEECNKNAGRLGKTQTWLDKY
jgi:predicted RNA-binding Zn-ribbon protein involved in translation (DUF1610 family)